MFLYIVTNTKNGRQYVGQTTVSVETRWRRHIKSAYENRRRGCRILWAAIRKHGADAFAIEPIALAPGSSQEDLDQAERETIQRLHTLAPNGYNLREGGEGGTLHPETRRLLSLALTGKVRTAEMRAAIGAASRRSKQNPAVRKKMSDKARRRFESPVAREQAARLQRGKKATLETRAKLSAIMKRRDMSYMNTPEMIAHRLALRRPCSAETRAKLSAAARNCSPETRAKMSSAARRKPPVSDETRRRMSVAHQRRHQQPNKEGAQAWAS